MEDVEDRARLREGWVLRAVREVDHEREGPVRRP